MSETMLERVAKAIAAADDADKARAAIEAMREPTEVMEYAASCEDYDYENAGFEEHWRAGIDAALTNDIERKLDPKLFDNSVVCWSHGCRGNFSSPLSSQSRAVTKRPEECACFVKFQSENPQLEWRDRHWVTKETFIENIRCVYVETVGPVGPVRLESLSDELMAFVPPSGKSR